MERYSGLKSAYEEKEYFFFQNFKMELHNEEVSKGQLLYAF